MTHQSSNLRESWFFHSENSNLLLVCFIIKKTLIILISIYEIFDTMYPPFASAESLSSRCLINGKSGPRRKRNISLTTDAVLYENT